MSDLDGEDARMLSQAPASPQDAALAVLALDPHPGGEPSFWLEPLRAHFVQVESHLAVAWVAVAGPGQTESYDGFDTVVQVNGEMDLGLGLNLVLAGLRAPFLLWADKGWSFANPQRRPFCSPSIAALQSDERFGQVKLHTDDHLDFEDRSVYSGPVFQKDSVHFFVQSPRKVMGGASLGPAITKVDVLLDLGPLREGSELEREDIEAELCARSTDRERCLSLRSPDLVPFSPSSGGVPARRDLLVEGVL